MDSDGNSVRIALAIGGGAPPMEINGAQLWGSTAFWGILVKPQSAVV